MNLKFLDDGWEKIIISFWLLFFVSFADWSVVVSFVRPSKVLLCRVPHHLRAKRQREKNLSTRQLFFFLLLFSSKVFKKPRSRLEQVFIFFFFGRSNLSPAASERSKSIVGAYQLAKEFCFCLKNVNRKGRLDNWIILAALWEFMNRESGLFPFYFR
jgi:hypothetical protein